MGARSECSIIQPGVPGGIQEAQECSCQRLSGETESGAARGAINRTSSAGGSQRRRPQGRTRPLQACPGSEGPVSLTFAWQLPWSSVKMHANPSCVPLH